MTMTSRRPHIVRAYYEWILENDCTPYVLVNALADHVKVPRQYVNVKSGQIILNIAPVAVLELLLSNEAIQFNGRFGGVPMDVYVPMTAVMGIYAKENGQGKFFEMEDAGPAPIPPNDQPPRPARPSLKVIK